MVEPDESIGITYVDQAIPSPYGMPRYEEIKEWNAALPENEVLYMFEESIDITGARVSSYCEFCRQILTVRQCKRMIPYSMEKPLDFSDENCNRIMIDLKLQQDFSRTMKQHVQFLKAKISVPGITNCGNFFTSTQRSGEVRCLPQNF